MPVGKSYVRLLQYFQMLRVSAAPSSLIDGESVCCSIVVLQVMGASLSDDARVMLTEIGYKRQTSRLQLQQSSDFR